ncbi:MAG: YlxR family protein [Anaerolineales bacterium]
MAKKTKRRTKHIPRRTCVGCREVLPKRSLIRIVKGPDGVKVDPSGKAHGRGAYLHDKRSCWLLGMKGALDHAFGIKLTDQEKEDLRVYMENQVPDDSTAPKGAEG